MNHNRLVLFKNFRIGLLYRVSYRYNIHTNTDAIMPLPCMMVFTHRIALYTGVIGPAP